MSQPCPNCKQDIPDTAQICPNCGAAKPQVTAAKPATLTGSPVFDFLLGFGLGVGAVFLYGIGLIILFLIAAAYSKRAPYFFRGVGTVLFIIGLLILGLFYACSHSSF